MQLETWLVKCVRQDCKNLLLNSQKVCPVEFIAKLRYLTVESTNNSQKARQIASTLSKWQKRGQPWQGPRNMKNKENLHSPRAIWGNTFEWEKPICTMDLTCTNHKRDGKIRKITWTFFSISNKRLRPVSAIFLSVWRNARFIESMKSFGCCFFEVKI